jgi:hypothetical protein
MESSNSSIDQQQAADGTTPPPPADTNQQGSGSPKYDQMVSDAVKALAAVRAGLPALPASLTALTGRRHRAVTREFLASALTAVKSSPELRAIAQLDPDQGADSLALLDAGSLMVKELESTVEYVRLVMFAAKTQFGADAREAYKAAKGMSQTVKGSGLNVHVDAMKRDGRFAGKRGKKKEGGNQPMQKQM